MTPWIVFFDIDGTLAMPGSPPSPKTVKAIEQLRERGNLAFLSTGRPLAGVPDEVAKIIFDGGIFSAGGRSIVKGQTISRHYLGEDLRRQICDVLEELRINYCMECEEDVFWSLTNPDAFASLRLTGAGTEFVRIVESWIESSSSVQDYDGTPIYKISFFCLDIEEVHRLEKALDGRAKLVQFANLEMDFPYIGCEISDWDINKGRAIREVCSYLDIPVEHTIGFGDSMNDFEMIETVGIGVAMDNSDQKLKEAADRICESCAEDGVWKELVRLGIISDTEC